MNPDKKVQDMSMKEINNYIGFTLQEKLTEFIYSRTRKQLERKSNFKVDVISWNCRKYGEILHLSFCGLIRHNEIDGLYETLFNTPKDKEFVIWDGFSGLGDTSANTQYHIQSVKNLGRVLAQVSLYMQERIEAFFNRFVSDSDFLRCLYQDKKIESYNEIFALKRIMLSCLLDKTLINDVHRYNLSCCQSAPSGTDFYVKLYKKGLLVLQKYYADIELPLD